METHYEIRSPNGQKLAVLDSNTTRVLREVQQIGHIRLQLLLKRKTTLNGKMSQRTGAEASITLYSPQNLAQRIGDTLGEAGKFLQHPDVVDAGVHYTNPQYFRSPGEGGHLDHLVGTSADDALPMRSILLEVDGIMDSLDKVQESQDIFQSCGILTPLMRYLPSTSW